MVAQASAIAGNLVAALLLIRAWRGGYLSRFRLFYSYIGFLLLSSMTLWPIYIFSESLYRSIAWPYVMITLLVEYAVLVEITDHLFSSFPTIRGVACLISVGLCLSLLVLYVIPPALERQRYDLAIFGLEVRVAVSQAIMLLVLLVMAQYYGITLDRNLRGLCVGFAILTSGRIANDAIAAYTGPSYASTYFLMQSLAGLGCMVAWAYGLWQVNLSQKTIGKEEVDRPLLVRRLKILNQELTRLLR